MARGGFRPGAGRPKASPDKVPRRRKAPPIDLVRFRAIQDKAGALLDHHESEVVNRILGGSDDRLRFEVVKWLRSYVSGLPKAAAALPKGEEDNSPEAVLDRIAARRSSEERYGPVLDAEEVRALPPATAAAEPAPALSVGPGEEPTALRGFCSLHGRSETLAEHQRYLLGDPVPRRL